MIQSWPEAVHTSAVKEPPVTLRSGKKKEHKLKLLGPDTFQWGGGLLPEGAGVKNFGMSPETHGKQIFWQDIPGFSRDIPGRPKILSKKRVMFNSCPSQSPDLPLPDGLAPSETMV